MFHFAQKLSPTYSRLSEGLQAAADNTSGSCSKASLGRVKLGYRWAAQDPLVKDNSKIHGLAST